MKRIEPLIVIAAFMVTLFFTSQCAAERATSNLLLKDLQVKEDSISDLRKALDKEMKELKKRDTVYIREYKERKVQVTKIDTAKMNSAVDSIRSALTDSLKPTLDSVLQTYIVAVKTRDDLIAAGEKLISSLKVQVVTAERIISLQEEELRNKTRQIEVLKKKSSPTITPFLVGGAVATLGFLLFN